MGMVLPLHTLTTCAQAQHRSHIACALQQKYNGVMRAATLLLTSLLLSAPVLAQDKGENSPQPNAQAPEQLTKSEQKGDKRNQRIERIRVEDGGSRVDELRVGGETKNITVQPKVGNLPSYEVQPQNNEGSDGTNGRRVWRALQF